LNLILALVSIELSESLLDLWLIGFWIVKVSMLSLRLEIELLIVIFRLDVLFFKFAAVSVVCFVDVVGCCGVISILVSNSVSFLLLILFLDLNNCMKL
jgi:hypothetical protein